MGPYDPPTLGQIIGLTPWDPDTINFGDEPKDHEAVTFGIKLWQKYQSKMSLVDFKNELVYSIPRMGRCSPKNEGVPTNTASSWPYAHGYFDNKGASYDVDPRGCQ
jgi:hypothetical protein